LKVTAFAWLLAVGRRKFFYHASDDLAYRVGQNIEHAYAVAWRLGHSVLGWLKIL